MMERFGFGEEVATLTVSLYIAGYCLGPLLWGPLSEDVSCFELSHVGTPLIHTLDRPPPSLLNNVPV